jgi:hypothetical protein
VLWRRYKEEVKIKRQRRAEEWESWHRAQRGEGELSSIDLGQFGRAEPGENKPAQDVPKERRWVGDRGL